MRTNLRIFSAHKALESIGKVGPTVHKSSGGSSPSPCSITHSYTAQAATTATPVTCLACQSLSLSMTAVDRQASTSFENSGIYLIRACGLRTPSSPIPGVGLGGLVPRTESISLGRLVPRNESAGLGGLTLTSADFYGVCTHRPRIRIDGISAYPERFIARGYGSVASTEGCTGHFACG